MAYDRSNEPTKGHDMIDAKASQAAYDYFLDLEEQGRLHSCFEADSNPQPLTCVRCRMLEAGTAP